MSQYISYSARGGSGGGTTIPMYVNFAAFPISATNGTIAIALDTGLLYEYNSVTPGWQLITALNPIPSSQKGANNGVATLDSGGKVPASQLPSTVMEFQGVWNANTNTPTLANGTGNAGDVYLCNVAGTTNFGAGPISFALGDWAIYDGSIWQKSLNSNAVVSVNGLQGVVTLTTDNVNEGSTNLYFTTSRARTAAVVNTLAGSETDQAPSVAAVNSAISAATGANTALSNLATTALNASLVPNTAGAIDLGSSTKPFGVTYSKSLYTLDGSNAIVGILTYNTTGPTLLSNVTNGDVTLQPAGTGSVIVQNKKITSLADPTNAQDAATKSYVDTAITAGAGANTSLSNLGTTAINANLLPTGTRALGGPSNVWDTIFVTSISNGTVAATQAFGDNTTKIATTAFVASNAATLALSNLASVAINTSLLPATTGVTNIGSSSKIWNNLHVEAVDIYSGAGVFSGVVADDSAGGVSISAVQSNSSVTLAPTGTGTIVASSKKITSLADPTSAQDAATKNYVDNRPIAPTIQKFTSGSGTYTTPTSPRSPLYIKVRMVGAGGGGGASSTSNGSFPGSAGGNSTFGSSLLTANGGSGGNGSGGTPGGGGTASISSPAIGTALTGGTGFSEANLNGSLSFWAGGGGGSNPLGGGGSAVGAANTGAGGAGAGSAASGLFLGAGGGAGGYVDAIIPSPSATYAYAVGAAGAGGTGGSFNGNAGAAGYIEVIEYYQ